MRLVPVMFVGNTSLRLWSYSGKNDLKQFQSLISNQIVFPETILSLQNTEEMEGSNK